MKHKSRLTALTAVFAVAAFYTFANCMVREIDNVELDYSVAEVSAEVNKAEALPEPDDAVYDVPQDAGEAVTEEAVTEETGVPDESDDADSPEIITMDMAVEPEGSVSDDESPLEEYTPEEEAAVTVRAAADKALGESVTEVTTAPETMPETVPETEAETSFATAMTAYELDEMYMTETAAAYADEEGFEVEPAGGDYNPFEETAYTEMFETEPDVTVAPIDYAETLTVLANGSSVTLDAYTMVCKIVANEVSVNFAPEAIKAQAVAAYSYVKHNNLHGQYPDVLLANTVPDKIASCVSEVWGQACYYNGEIALACYSASSAGSTASSSNVWGGNRPYLVSVDCPFDAANDPNYGKTMQMSESEVRGCLERSLGISLSDDPEKWIVVSSKIDGNYVGTVTIDGMLTLTGRQLREQVFGYRIRSASFNVAYADGVFTFTTYGYGHGVGMSQNGANILANMGYDYISILKYYFTGITVQ